MNEETEIPLDGLVFDADRKGVSIAKAYFVQFNDQKLPSRPPERLAFRTEVDGVANPDFITQIDTFIGKAGLGQNILNLMQALDGLMTPAGTK